LYQKLSKSIIGFQVTVENVRDAFVGCSVVTKWIDNSVFSKSSSISKPLSWYLYHTIANRQLTFTLCKTEVSQNKLN